MQAVVDLVDPVEGDALVSKTLVERLRGAPQRIGGYLTETSKQCITHCQIAFPASPPGVCPALSFRWRIPEPRDRWLHGDARVRQVRATKMA